MLSKTITSIPFQNCPLTHCTEVNPQYTQPSSVSLRLINKSKIFSSSALPDYHLFPVGCGLLSPQCCCFAWCLVTQPESPASSQDATAHQAAPCWSRCFIPSRVIIQCPLAVFTVSCNSNFLQKGQWNRNHSGVNSAGQLE